MICWYFRAITLSALNEAKVFKKFWLQQSCKIIYFYLLCRYLNPPNNWVVCSLESRELMALCLKRLKNLAKVKLIEADFVWTEPHSKRIKVIESHKIKVSKIEASMMIKPILRSWRQHGDIFRISDSILEELMLMVGFRLYKMPILFSFFFRSNWRFKVKWCPAQFCSKLSLLSMWSTTKCATIADELKPKILGMLV